MTVTRSCNKEKDASGKKYVAFKCKSAKGIKLDLFLPF